MDNQYCLTKEEYELFQTLKNKHEENLKNSKNYYAQNKDKLLAKLHEMVSCPNCGSQVQRNHIYRHKQTNICKKRALANKKQESDDE